MSLAMLVARGSWSLGPLLLLVVLADAEQVLDKPASQCDAGDIAGCSAEAVVSDFAHFRS
jgi:hypothetical protein